MSPRRAQHGRGALIVVLLWAWALLWTLGPRPTQAAELTLTFFDIGQGDASLIVSPTGKRILIDGGQPEAGARLVAGLRRRGIDALDLIILSHPHMDHLGGLKEVVGALPVRLFLDAAFPSTSPGYGELLRLMEARGVTLTQAILERRIDIGAGASLQLLGPPNPWLHNTRSDVNANSVLVRLTWQQRSALFTGDAEPETERWLLARPAGTAALGSEVLKVAHHGGRFSSTAAFLQAVRPQLSVISVGARNDYGHPTPEALARLAEVRARVLRTDLQGDVTLRSRDGGPWTVETQRAAEAAATAPPRPDPARTSPRAEAPAAAGEVVGSRRTTVFHRHDCSGARQITPANRVTFPSREAALAAGRRPAADCRP